MSRAGSSTAAVLADSGAMVVQLGIAAVVLVVAIAVALVVRSRTTVDEPTQPPGYPVPLALDRTDFVRPDVPWLVVAFTSATCLSCAESWDKVRLLESDVVAVQDVEVSAHKDLHERYGIEAVPMILIADEDGDVRASYVGTPTAADLWAAMAELREPGSTPEACDHHRSAPAT